MKVIKVAVFAAMALVSLVQHAVAQSGDGTLVFSTVHRPPFAILDQDTAQGFSIDLMRAIAEKLGREVQFVGEDSFSAMLGKVQDAEVDGAIANISITAAREGVMDFSLPIFESGLQIMLPAEGGLFQQFSVLMTRDILVLGLLSLGLLFGGGMLMWAFERRHQPYFDRSARDAMFPSFWWALNLVVNGGFEERMPMSRAGRFFAVMMVVASLFVVSVFVATITAAVTVDALQSNVDSINDLEGRRVATVQGSTSAEFLNARQITFTGYDDPQQMLSAFDTREVDAVVFDGPILAYYVLRQAKGRARLIDRVYRSENYGIALPPGSPLREPVNRALLGLQEDGTYFALLERWFGATFRRR